MSTNLAFIAALLTGSGYLVAPDAPIGATSSLTNVFVPGNRLSFERCLDDRLVSFFARQEPGSSRAAAGRLAKPRRLP